VIDTDAAELADHHRAALRYADAHMTDPRKVDAAELRRWLTDQQIVELSLDVTAWSKQKVLVALELDEPVDPAAPTPLTFDAAGRFHVG
jgi:alkylhydroperoxidase family enzyme